MTDYKTRDPKGWCGDPKRGAALGRHTYNEPTEDTFDKPLTLKKVKIDKDGYDTNGTYFGVGLPLFWLASEDGTIDRVFRAKNQSAAREHASTLYPKAKFRR